MNRLPENCCALCKFSIHNSGVSALDVYFFCAIFNAFPSALRLFSWKFKFLPLNGYVCFTFEFSPSPHIPTSFHFLFTNTSSSTPGSFFSSTGIYCTRCLCFRVYPSMGSRIPLKASFWWCCGTGRNWFSFK